MGENGNVYIWVDSGSAGSYRYRTIITHIMPHRFKGMMWGKGALTIEVWERRNQRRKEGR